MGTFYCEMSTTGCWRKYYPGKTLESEAFHSWELWPINSEELKDPVSRSNQYLNYFNIEFIQIKGRLLGSREDYRSSEIFDIFILSEIFIIPRPNREIEPSESAEPYNIFFHDALACHQSYKTYQNRGVWGRGRTSKPVVINFRQLIDSKLSIRLF